MAYGDLFFVASTTTFDSISSERLTMLKLLRKLRSAVAGAIKGAFRRVLRFGFRLWMRKRIIAVGIAKMVLSLASAALTVYVLDYFLPTWLTAAIASTVFVHEMGHYITAKRLGRQVDPPLFLPFIWGVVGATRIHARGSDPERDAQIHLAGPTWGFIWALAGAGFSLYFGQSGMMWAFLWLSAFNLWHGTLGSDGKFYQSMKSQFTPDVEEPTYEKRWPETAPGTV